MSSQYSAAAAVYCSNCGAPVTAGSVYCTKCGTQQPLAAAPVPYAPVSAVRYGGFWIRFVAVIIDSIIVGFLTWPVMLVLAGSMHTYSGDPADLGLLFARTARLGFASIGIRWLYEAFLTSSSKQATVGKMAFGLRIVGPQGETMSFARATGRHFAKYLSGLLLLIGYIMAAFDARKQALHDKIVDTFVVRG